MWLKYADVEMKNKLIMPGIANSTKSSEGSRKISPRFASSPDTTQKSSPGLTTRKLKTTRLEVNSSSPKKPSIKIPKSTSPIISASHLEVPFMRFGC
nr:hypothetical protein [Tanacetum cinerariifolium]